MSPPRVGFIINSRVPSAGAFARGMPPHALALGWDDAASPMSFMRFRWIADEVNREGAARYELFKPWRRYDAVVFVKSMGAECAKLARRLRGHGTRVIFEANVDYYTVERGGVLFPEMAPTPRQREDAIEMTRGADAVIASSRRLAEICAGWNARASWVPDNVDLRMVPPNAAPEPIRGGRLQVWWSGMASKLCEFLAVAGAFESQAGRIHLHLVTGPLDALSRWSEATRRRFEAFLGCVPHTIHAFRGIGPLLRLYSQGGVIVSPRFLDAPYNLSHSEWKITLGMACGLPAVASPVPSYLDVARHAPECAVIVCPDAESWRGAIEGLLESPDALIERGAEAAAVVREYYATAVVARQHAAAVRSAMEG